MTDSLKPLDEASLRTHVPSAWRSVVVVLVSLWVAKSVGGGWLGTAAATLAMGLQLYLPIRWLQQTSQPDAVIGWHRKALARDLRLVCILCLATFPFYAVAHIWFMEHGRQLVIDLGGLEVARFIPQRRWALEHFWDAISDWERLTWFAERCATHVFGVALPEETFYRGFLLTITQSVWVPQRTLLGVKFGKAAVITNLAFALGHVIGEWNPLRFGPFFPGLLFAWLFNATGSIWGAVAFHAAANIFGELLALGYV